jgi:hypothetical protein
MVAGRLGVLRRNATNTIQGVRTATAVRKDLLPVARVAQGTELYGLQRDAGGRFTPFGVCKPSASVVANNMRIESMQLEPVQVALE